MSAKRGGGQGSRSPLHGKLNFLLVRGLFLDMENFFLLMWAIFTMWGASFGLAPHPLIKLSAGAHVPTSWLVYRYLLSTSSLSQPYFFYMNTTPPPPHTPHRLHPHSTHTHTLSCSSFLKICTIIICYLIKYQN